MKNKRRDTKAVLSIALIVFLASCIPLFYFNLELTAGTEGTDQPGSNYGTIGYQAVTKEEIRTEESMDGISFVILGDGTVRITKFPVGYDGWNEDTTEMRIPGKVTTSSGQEYIVSELSNTAAVLKTGYVGGNPYGEIDISGQLLKCTKLILPTSLEKICDETSYYDYDMYPSNVSILSLKNLASIEFEGDGQTKLNYIGSGAFRDVESFPLKIPASVEYIGAAAFKSLKQVQFEDGSRLEYVGDAAFSGLEPSQTISLPEGFKYLGSAMPFGQAAVDYPASFITSEGVVYDSSSKVAYSYSGSKETVNIKAGTETISAKTFLGSTIKVVNLPSSVNKIEEYAFANCKFLETVSYDVENSTLTSIGKGAFSAGWTAGSFEMQLKQMGSTEDTIQFPSSLQIVGENAFGQLTNMGTWSNSSNGNGLIKSVVFSDKNQLARIGDHAFANFYALESIRFGSSSDDNSGVILGEGAFLINEGKTSPALSVSFESSFKLKEIGDHCFSVYKREIISVLERYEVNNKRMMEQFGPQAKKITIVPSLEKIGDHAFFGCTGDANNGGWSIIAERNSVLSGLGSAAFYAFGGLSKIDLSDADSLNVISINVFNAGNQINRLEELILPPNIQAISNFAFYNQSYSGTSKIELPRTMTTIGSFTFSATSADYFTFKNPLMRFDINNPSFPDLNTNDIIGNATKITNNAKVLNLSTIPATFKRSSLDYQGNTLFVLMDSSGQITDDGTGSILCCKLDGKLTIVRAGNETSGVVVIPEKTDRILMNAFQNCKEFEAVIIEGKDTIIDDSAFNQSNKSKLKTILSASDKIDTTAVNGTRYGTSLLSLSGHSKSTPVVTKGAYWMGQSYYNAEDGRVVFFSSNIEGKTISVRNANYDKGILTFELSCSDWYSAPDFIFKNGETVLEIDHYRGTYTFSTDDKLIWIEINEKAGGEERTVTVHGDGGYFDDDPAKTQHVITLNDGKTIHESQFKIPYRNIMEVLGWYTNSERTERFDLLNDAVTEDLNLYPVWETVAPRITFAKVNGTISAISNGKIVQNGERISGSINLTFSAPEGYEIDVWIISEYGRDPVEFETPILTITPENDVTISVRTHHFSGTNLQPVTSADVPTSSMVRSWIRGGVVNTGMNVWTGLASTPVIVDDYVYVRVSSMLYKIEADTGYIAATAKSRTVVDYYHYVGYGNGQILDYSTAKVYDLDLNFLYYMPTIMTSATYHDGYFYGPGSDGKVYRFTSDIPGDGIKRVDPNWTVSIEWFGMYGQSSAPVFADGYIYYINAIGDDRYIVSASLTDATTQRIRLESISKHMLDEGWLTYYGGRLYLTSYTVGLFGTKSANGEAMITSVRIDSGRFSDVMYTEVVLKLTKTDGSVSETPLRSMQSQFVIVDGIGYLNASGGPGEKSYLLAYSIEDMALYAYGESERSHGSIVVNQFDGTITIYLLPYESNKLLKAYQYEMSSGKPKLNSYGIYTLKSILDRTLYVDPSEKNTYNSQAVRTDSEGRLFWYNDDGWVRSYTTSEKNRFFFFIENEGVAQWYESYGATAADALKALGSDVVTLTTTNGLATVYGQNGEEWNLYYLKNDIMGYQDPENSPNGWKATANLFDKTLNTYHYYAITKGMTVPSTIGYTFEDGTGTSTYIFVDNIGDRSIVGKKLYASAELFTIRFYDGNEELEHSKLMGAKNSKIKGSFPSVSKANHIAQWYVRGTDNRVFELPKVFSEDLEYEVRWVEATYVMDAETETAGETVFFDLSVNAKAGESYLVDPHIILFAKYENDFFLKSFTGELKFVDGKATAKLGVGNDRLSYVIAYLVEGTPTTQMYSDYAVYEYTVEGTGSR